MRMFAGRRHLFFTLNIWSTCFSLLESVKCKIMEHHPTPFLLRGLQLEFLSRRAITWISLRFHSLAADQKKGPGFIEDDRARGNFRKQRGARRELEKPLKKNTLPACVKIQRGKIKLENKTTHFYEGQLNSAYEGFFYQFVIKFYIAAKIVFLHERVDKENVTYFFRVRFQILITRRVPLSQRTINNCCI